MRVLCVIFFILCLCFLTKQEILTDENTDSLLTSLLSPDQECSGSDYYQPLTYSWYDDVDVSEVWFFRPDVRPWTILCVLFLGLIIEISRCCRHH